MTSRWQYRLQLHARSPLAAVPATYRAILFHNKAGGSHRAQRHRRWPCRACDSGQVTLAHTQQSAAGRAERRQKLSAEGFERPGQRGRGVTHPRCYSPTSHLSPRAGNRSNGAHRGRPWPLCRGLRRCRRSDRGFWPHPGNNRLPTALCVTNATSGAPCCVPASAGKGGDLAAATGDLPP